MRIKFYSEQYFIDIVEIVKNFHDEAVGEYDAGIDLNVLAHTIKTGNPENAFLLIDDEDTCQGLLYGICQQSVTSGQMMFQEMIWYVNQAYRKYGVKLLREAEKNLKSRGVSIMIMAVLENSKTEKLKLFYEKLGYKPMETHFVRTL